MGPLSTTSQGIGLSTPLSQSIGNPSLARTTSVVNNTAKTFLGKYSFFIKGAAVLSTWQISLLAGGAIFATAVLVVLVAVLVIRKINSYEITYPSSGSGTKETKSDNEQNHTSDDTVPSDGAASSSTVETNDDEYDYSYYNPIEANRSYNLYNPTAPRPRPLLIREPSDKIKLLQLKLFFNTPEKKETENNELPQPPKLVHLTKDRPKPPGRLTRQVTNRSKH